MSSKIFKKLLIMKGNVIFMYFDPNLKCHYRVKKPQNDEQCAMMSKLGVCMAFTLLGATVVYIAVKCLK